MEGSQGPAPNNSSDFVGLSVDHARCQMSGQLTARRFASSTSTRDKARRGAPGDTDMKPNRMLENPQDESVVRWGNEGDSFVVLEVCHAPCKQKVEVTDTGYRTRSSPSTSFPSTSSTATSRASCAS